MIIKSDGGIFRKVSFPGLALIHMVAHLIFMTAWDADIVSLHLREKNQRVRKISQCYTANS